jgi:hypothetical protein
MSHHRLFLSLAFSASVFCQAPGPGPNVVHLAPEATVKVRAGATVKVALSVQVDEGFHVNSNTPADPFLIPLRLRWNPGPIESVGIAFPKPQLEKYSFSDKPVSVFTGGFEIITRFKVPAGAVPGVSTLTGKLHYQACNDKNCLTPKTIEVTLPVEIEAVPLKGGASWQGSVTLTEPIERGYWTDPETHLTWTTADNGSGVTLSQAVYYCQYLTLGGHKDWTLAPIDDLQRLFGGEADQLGHHVTGPIKLTGWVWSSSAGNEPGEEWALDFGDGGRASVVTGDSGLNRALCVRR